MAVEVSPKSCPCQPAVSSPHPLLGPETLEGFPSLTTEGEALALDTLGYLSQGGLALIGG